MDKLKKIGLTALGTSIVAASTAVAGELGVSGTAQISFRGQEHNNDGNGWTMTDSLTFSGSADLDNGWTVSYSQAVDGAAAGNTDISVNMGDMGTYKFVKSGTSGPVASWDDMMPSANEESYANVAGATGPDNGFASNNSHLYSNASLMEGVNISLGYQPSDGATNVGSTTEYGIQYTGIEGLAVGYAGGDNEATTTNEIENTVMYVTYAMDAFTVGVQDNESDHTTASADTEFRAYGISYAVTDELSVSYGIATVDYENTSLSDQDSNAISASYTNGSMTVSATHAKVENIAGTATNDRNGYEVNFTFAF
jgi:outer membrane protein OmpU